MLDIAVLTLLRQLVEIICLHYKDRFNVMIFDRRHIIAFCWQCCCIGRIVGWRNWRRILSNSNFYSLHIIKIYCANVLLYVKTYYYKILITFTINMQNIPSCSIWNAIVSQCMRQNAFRICLIHVRRTCYMVIKINIVTLIYIYF